MNEWYPQNKEELNLVLNKLLDEKTKNKKKNNKNIHGLIVPHAGYAFSGKIAGKAFSLLKNNKNKKAIILAPSHYVAFKGIASLNKIKNSLGEMKIINNDFPKLNYEHAIDNQIPFLQKLNFQEVLPLVIGEINEKQAEEIAQTISSMNAIYIFSTDLSHFFPYEQALKKDKETIEIIENLDLKNFNKIDACGRFPLLIFMHLCKIKKVTPKLIQYKNSGDISGDKTSVVGYSSFFF